MKLEQQVTSLELSKRLKELNVRQESHFWWIKGYSDDEFVIANPINKLVSQADADMMKREFEYYSAFTVAELGELLEKASYSNLCDAYKYLHQRNDIDKFDLLEHMKKPNFGAVMLVYLLENDILPAPGERG